MKSETNIIGFMLISFDHSMSNGLETEIYHDLKSAREAMRAAYDEACGRDYDDDEDYDEDDEEDTQDEGVYDIDDWGACVYFDTGDGDYAEHIWKIVILKLDGNKIKQISPTDL